MLATRFGISGKPHDEHCLALGASRCLFLGRPLNSGGPPQPGRGVRRWVLKRPIFPSSDWLGRSTMAEPASRLVHDQRCPAENDGRRGRSVVPQV